MEQERCISEIIPSRLYLCGQAAISTNALRKLKITNILYILGEPVEYDSMFTVKHILMEDAPQENILATFAEAHEFLDAANARNERTLVHCQKGVSRSATIVISYVMKVLDKQLFEAHLYVKQRRPAIDLNSGFCYQLVLYNTALYPDTAEESSGDNFVIELFRARFCDYAEVVSSTNEQIWQVLKKHNFDRQEAYYELAGLNSRDG